MFNMADRFRSTASQQNPEQFLHRSSAAPPSDFRMMNPRYRQPHNEVGGFPGEGSFQTTAIFRPPFVAPPQFRPAPPRNPFPYTQGSSHPFQLLGDKDATQPPIRTYPNANNSPDFRTNRYMSPASQPHGVRAPFPLPGVPDRLLQPVYGSPHGVEPQPMHGMQVASSGECATAQADQAWVKEFVQQRCIINADQDENGSLKIWEAKELLRKWGCLITDLKNQRDKLIECISFEDTEWEKLLKKAEHIEEKVSKVEAIFSNPELSGKLEKLVSLRKKRRARQKSCRRTRLAVRKEAEEKRSLLHKQIDSWREQAISKEEASRKAALLKSEAGGVLGEVRRKLSETTKALELLKSLGRLRDIRKQEAERKGVYRRPTDGEDKYFNERLQHMEKLMTRRQALYEVEQKALEVMLTEEEEEKLRKKREERRTQQDLFKAKDPMEIFCNYYNQADQSLQSLLQIRHQWDTFLVSEHVPGASRVPQGWVSAVGPSSGPWASLMANV